MKRLHTEQVGLIEAPHCAGELVFTPSVPPLGNKYSLQFLPQPQTFWKLLPCPYYAHTITLSIQTLFTFACPFVYKTWVQKPFIFTHLHVHLYTKHESRSQTIIRVIPGNMVCGFYNVVMVTTVCLHPYRPEALPQQLQACLQIIGTENTIVDHDWVQKIHKGLEI